MNEEYRDVEEVLMVIKKATMFADPIMKIATKGLAKNCAVSCQNGEGENH